MLNTKEFKELKSLVGRRLRKKDADRLDILLNQQGVDLLGAGCGRIAYSVKVHGYEQVVLKFIGDPYDNHKDNLTGRAQNRHEIWIYKNFGHLKYVPRFFDWDSKHFRWIEMELLQKSRKSDRPMMDAVRKFVQKVNDIREDEVNPVIRPDHWGINRYGTPKLIDMGAAKHAW